ncbi:MAG: YfjI family protein, partial [Actinopolymorphaceae bacterium]
AAAVAAKADPMNRAQAMAEASDAAMTAKTIEVPVMPTLVADDITPEAAAGLLAEQGGRLAVLSDEGGIFATLAGRYSGVPNLEVFLKGHAGTMLRVHRRGRDPELIDNPALTLGLAVQPEVLHDIAQMPGFRGRGLLARILYSVPENTVGRRRIGTAPVPELVADTYTQNLQAFVLTLADLQERAFLPLSDDAGEAVLALEADVEPKLAPTAAWAHVVDWGSKYVGAVIRLAGVIHLADHLRDGWQQPITADTIDRAAALGQLALLEHFHVRLDVHFRALHKLRQELEPAAPVFPLEHGLEPNEKACSAAAQGSPASSQPLSRPPRETTAKIETDHAAEVRTPTSEDSTGPGSSSWATPAVVRWRTRPDRARVTSREYVAQVPSPDQWVGHSSKRQRSQGKAVTAAMCPPGDGIDQGGGNEAIHLHGGHAGRRTRARHAGGCDGVHVPCGTVGCRRGTCRRDQRLR